MSAITIRFPDELAVKARIESQAEGESMNQFVVSAVTDAVQRRRAQRALGRMAERRAGMRAAGRVAPASENLIRKLREGEGRRD
jgi:predicted transcriptional regulator